MATARRILVVDDNATMRPLIATAFKGLEVGEIEFANDGREALRLSIANRYDIMVIDSLMPHTSGLDFIRLRRDRIVVDHTAVVLMAVLPDEDVLAACRSKELPIHDVIVKPFTIELMRARLRRLMERHLRRGGGRAREDGTQVPKDIGGTGDGTGGSNEVLRGVYLSCALTTAGDSLVAKMSGIVTVHDRPMMADICDRIIQTGGISRLVLDLNHVDRPDEYGLGCLMVMNAILNAAGKAMHVVANNEHMVEQFEATFLARIISCGRQWGGFCANG